MHEVIFHFPCSISWHGKAAGLCPRSSCISSPGKRFLRAAGPDPQRNSLPPSRPPPRLRSGEGCGPTPFSCTWAARRREPCCYLSFPPPPPCVCYNERLAAAPPGRGGGGGESGGIRAAPRSAAHRRCVEPQRPLLGQSGAARPAAAEGASALAQRGAELRGGGGVVVVVVVGSLPGFPVSCLGVLLGLLTLMSSPSFLIFSHYFLFNYYFFSCLL